MQGNIKNRLLKQPVFYITLHKLLCRILYTYRITVHGQLELYGGAEICFNFNGRIKNKYTQEAPGVPQKFTNVRLETWTWNYIAGINFGDLGVYAKYSPCPFLEKGYGPAFNSYSAGIVLNL